MSRRYSPEHDDPEQNVDHYLADRDNPEPEDLDERLKELEIESLWRQHEKEESRLLPEPEFEEIHARMDFESGDGRLLCFSEDFRELVKIKLAPKK